MAIWNCLIVCAPIRLLSEISHLNAKKHHYLYTTSIILPKTPLTVKKSLPRGGFTERK
jgi:hypothetical protein